MLLGAYGVSCRARVRTLRHISGDSPPPPSKGGTWVPRSSSPWGGGFGTNRRDRTRFHCNLHHIGRSATFFADGGAQDAPLQVESVGRVKSAGEELERRAWRYM